MQIKQVAPVVIQKMKLLMTLYPLLLLLQALRVARRKATMNKLTPVSDGIVDDDCVVLCALRCSNLYAYMHVGAYTVCVYFAYMTQGSTMYVTQMLTCVIPNDACVQKGFSARGARSWTVTLTMTLTLITIAMTVTRRTLWSRTTLGTSLVSWALRLVAAQLLLPLRMGMLTARTSGVEMMKRTTRDRSVLIFRQR